jgi:hypothetical protein
MGNDITPPLELDQPDLHLELDIRELFDDAQSVTIADAPAPVQFADISRWRELPPLRAARAYGSHAIEMADRAEWELGVARQAFASGDLLLAHDAIDRAARRINGARFLEALMSSALAGWRSTSPGRELSPPMRQLVVRVRTAVGVADRILNDLVGKSDGDVATDSGSGAA